MRVRLGLLREYVREAVEAGAPAAVGFYAPFDMGRDHTGDTGAGPWYRSPGQPAGSAGDPGRGPDAYAQLGFHPSAGATGETGVQARLAPPIWQLAAGSDTSSVLGAGARAPADSAGSTDGEAAGSSEGEAEGDGPPEGEQQDAGGPQRGPDGQHVRR